MQLLKKYVFFPVCVLGLVHTFAQQSPVIQKDYFRDPLAIPIELAANFGEVRKDHFHMGLDIRTQQKENLPVYAAADGYVSRISMERYGFGKAIYITHPGGYTTVYVHLNKFYDALDNYVKQKQYKDEQWEQDCTIPPGQFPVAKGQFIAWSGNTGASQGPHLHFEIRDNKTGNNLNPLLFNLGVTDNIDPFIYSLYWYDRRYSTYESGPKPIPIKKVNGGYVTTQQVVKVGSPQISLGIRAEDKVSPSSFLFGIYAAYLNLDNNLQFMFQINNFSYTDTRYLNACVDYSYWMNKGVPIQHLSRLPGNNMPIFVTNKEGGVLTLNDTLPHNVSIDVKDASGNLSTLRFKIQYDPALKQDLFFTMNGIKVLPGKENNLQTDNVRLHFSAFGIYDAVNFVLAESAPGGWPHASVAAQLHNYQVPVHDPYTVSLRLSNAALAVYSNRIVMTLQNPRYKAVQKPVVQGDWYTANFRNLGTVQLVVDTVAPSIQTIGWHNGSKLGSNSSIRLRCNDNLGEIKQFRALLDGKWLLFSHSTNDYIYSMDEHCSLGVHTLQVSVTDIAGNTTVKNFQFTKEAGIVKGAPGAPGRRIPKASKNKKHVSTKRRK